MEHLQQFLFQFTNPNTPTLRRRTQDEAGPSECRIQQQIELGILQFSLLIFQLENKALKIVLESKPMLSRNYQMVFKGCFENNAEEQMVSRISDDKGHRLWLQGPLNLLIREQRANYVAIILPHILEFLSI